MTYNQLPNILNKTAFKFELNHRIEALVNFNNT